MVQFASYLRRVLCKTRLIFPRINGPIEHLINDWSLEKQLILFPMKISKFPEAERLPFVRKTRKFRREFK